MVDNLRISLCSTSVTVFFMIGFCSGDVSVIFDLYKSAECKLSHFAVIRRQGTTEQTYYPLLVPDLSGIKYIVTLLGDLSEDEVTELDWVYSNNGGCCWAVNSVELRGVSIKVYSTSSVLYSDCFEGINSTISSNIVEHNFGFKTECQYKIISDQLQEVNCLSMQPVYSVDFYSPSVSVNPSSVASVNPSLSSVVSISPSSVVSSSDGSSPVTTTAATELLSSFASPSTNAASLSDSTITRTFFVSGMDTSSIAIATSTIASTVSPTLSSHYMNSSNAISPTSIPEQRNTTEFIDRVLQFQAFITSLAAAANSITHSTIMSTIDTAQAIIGLTGNNSSNDDAAVTGLLVALDDFGQLAPNGFVCSTENCTNESSIILSKVAVTSPVTEIEYPKGNSITNSLSFNNSSNVTLNIVSYYFRNLSSLLKPSEPSESIVSPIISALLQCTSGCDESIMVDNVIIQFNVEDFLSLNALNDSQMLSCVSIQLDSSTPFTGVWNDSGCSRIEDDTTTTDSIVKCTCSHLTHFAILLSPNSGHISEKHRRILNVIGFVLVPISLVCMIGVIVVYIMMKSLWNMRTYVHIMLCASMFMAQLLFITGVDRTNNEEICSGISMVLEYLFLVTFMWMLMEGVVLYVSLSKVFIKSAKYYIIIFTTASYGIPAVYMAVIIPIGVLVESGNKTQFLYQIDGETIACWLNYESHFIWSFISPVIIIILINIGFFLMTIIILRKHEKRGNKKSVWKWIKVAISLTTVMGITWLGGVFAFTKQLVAVAYVMTILISAQGLIIFVLLVLMSKQVRRGYFAFLKKHFPDNLFLNSSKLFTINSRLSSSSNNKSNSSTSKHAVNGIVLGTFTTIEAASQ